MKTLNSPLYELNQDSEYYKILKEVKDSQPKINEIIREIAELVGFESKEFLYYGSRGFGFYRNSLAYEKFENQLTKNPDGNGVYKFKRTSPTYKIISPKVLEIERIKNKVNPFALHDMLGYNNLVASQWVEDRFFVEVKSEDTTERILNADERRKQYEIEPVKEVSYKEYLELVMSELK